jgi:hypothetical protein
MVTQVEALRYKQEVAGSILDGVIDIILPVRRADNLTTFMCRLSINLGASTSWKPKGLSRSVMGLLYHFTT